MNSRLSTAIPKRMKHLERDKRGYPIPFIVLRDDEVVPHFSINDHRQVRLCIERDLCAICGDRLGANKWFVGGPCAAFHRYGRYIDGPLHRECGTYALQVCPYIAMAGTYTKRVDGRTLKSAPTKGVPEGQAVVLLDNTVHPDQPTVFIFANTGSYKVDYTSGHLNPARPWKAVEFWRDGQKIHEDDARVLIMGDPNLPVNFDSLSTFWPGIFAR